MNNICFIQVYEKVRIKFKFVLRHTARSGDYRPKAFLWAIRAALSI
jgi:hypothetical protein